MSRNREILIFGGLVLLALLVGAGIGHSFTGNGGDSTKPNSLTGSTPAPSATPIVKKSVIAQTKTGDAASKETVIHKSLADILKNPNAAARTKELEDFVRTLPPSEIGNALKQLRKMPEGSARNLATGLLVAHWIATDADGALAFATQNHDFNYIASDVFQQYASDDVQGALARAQAISDPNVRYQALRGVLSYMADSDPLGALQLANTLGTFPGNESLSQMIYRQWSQIDPASAAVAAAQVAADDGSNGGWRSPVNQVLRNWASQDPLAAIAWTDSQADPSAQAHDIGQIVRQWSRDDESAAANWVNDLGAGPVRDAAAASLAYSLGGTDPSAAINWAESIADPTQRDNAIQRLSREIMATNPSNGAAILQAAGIPITIPPPGGPGGGRGGP